MLITRLYNNIFVCGKLLEGIELKSWKMFESRLYVIKQFHIVMVHATAVNITNTKKHFPTECQY